jgi:hypothetical protein
MEKERLDGCRLIYVPSAYLDSVHILEHQPPSDVNDNCQAIIDE